jgi:hypothetical protein
VWTPGIDLGRLIDETLRVIDMSHKEAALTATMDPPQWTRALRGEQPLDLWKLRYLPLRFWQVFLPKFASALIQAWFDETVGERRMVRAELKDRQQERKEA